MIFSPYNRFGLIPNRRKTSFYQTHFQCTKIVCFCYFVLFLERETLFFSTNAHARTKLKETLNVSDVELPASPAAGEWLTDWLWNAPSSRSLSCSRCLLPPLARSLSLARSRCRESTTRFLGLQGRLGAGCQFLFSVLSRDSKQGNPSLSLRDDN